MSLARELEALGRPLVDAQLRHPTVVGIGRGDLPDEVFRAWLEQDYLFLHDYVRVFSRLAWQAPASHLGDLVELAHSTFFEELSLHRALAAEFGGVDLDSAEKGPVCSDYTAFLLDAAGAYDLGLAALYPCMWGYSALGRALAADPPKEPRFRRWVDTYADPGFLMLTGRVAAMLDEASPDRDLARGLFLRGMDFELAFWDVA